MGKFKKILVATDFSDISERAFFQAVDLAKELGASLNVVHIVQIHPASIPESGVVNTEEIVAQEEQRANERLDKYIQDYGEGLDISRLILHGDPATQISSVAKETGADFIVMGTHGRTGLFHLLMGSVAESVFKNAEVPVISVKGTQESG